MTSTRLILRAVPTEEKSKIEDTTDYIRPLNAVGRTRAGPARGASFRLQAKDETREQLESKPGQIVSTVEEPLPLSLIEPLQNNDAAAAEKVVSDAKLAKASWGIRELGLSDRSLSGKGVTVAVLDTGINRHHPAFAGMEICEKDFTGTGNGDTHGHGTHCAGTIFGRDFDDGDGRLVRIGVARGIERALIAKVIGGNGGLRELIQALDWAYEEGASIIAMSLGFDIYHSLRFKDADIPTAARLVNSFRDNVRFFDAYMEWRAAEKHGQPALVFAATGNVSNRDAYVVSKLSPAAAIGILSVGAVERNATDLSIAKFSNSEPDFVAPGVAIVSAGREGRSFAVMDGTSQACPHVAGLAALHWQQMYENATKNEPVSATMVAASLRASAIRSRKERFPGFSSSDIGAGMPGVP